MSLLAGLYWGLLVMVLGAAAITGFALYLRARDTGKAAEGGNHGD